MNKELLLHKWLNGEATPEEFERLRQDPDYVDLVELAAESSHFTLPEFDKDEHWQKLTTKTTKPSKVRRLSPVSVAIRIAAVLVLGLFTYVFVFNTEEVITAQLAQKSELILPDDSRVTLNAGSELSYNKRGWQDERSVELNGEAFFEVAKGQRFDVETEGGMVSVLGTEFNVKNRKDGFSVTCYEGLVQVTLTDTIFKLPAGSAFRMESGKLVFSSTNRLTPSWMSGESDYTNANVGSVLEELGRQYDLKIDLQTKQEKSFSGSFTHNDLEMALRSICEPLELTYEIVDGTVTIYEAQ